jgi:hypothetical protein
MEKYYTPEIEEFHVGFEYEILEMGSKTKYHPATLNDCDDLTGDYDGLTLLYEIASKRHLVRVKHLDREDIESLGFVFKKETESSYVKDNITMHVYDAKRWNTENDTITIFKKDLDRAVGKTIVFAGVVKNKSELKRILKQLNIIE